MRVAVVGAGPAGIYAAEALRRHGDVPVDVLDALPAPFGLVRYGVAPDHLKIKSIERTLRAVLEDPQVRFLGNVRIGTDVTVAELRERYDAVIYAYGASTDRRMGIPGEDLPGSLAATDLVSWYCGNPDSRLGDLELDAASAVVIGMGNVALDVVRLLARPSADLASTDVPRCVLDRFGASRLADIHLVGRRGPEHARFTTKELRELGQLGNADVIVDPADLPDAGDPATADLEPQTRRNLDVLAEWSARTPEGRPRRIHLRFRLRPVELLGNERVSAVELERTHVGASGEVSGTGERLRLAAQLVVRSVGYAGIEVEGLPFDCDRGVVPNASGRVLRDGAPSLGEYVAGWIKRGPTGVIGTNRSDAAETVRALLDDAAAGGLPAPRKQDDILALLLRRGVQVVPWQGWLAIERAEIDLGAQTGRQREKLNRRAELLAAAASR